MTDTPQPSAPKAAVLDFAAAAAAKAAQPQPRFRMVSVNLPNLLHTLLLAAMPAGKHLNDTIKLVADSSSVDEACRRISHYDAVRQWCDAHPEDAAHVVLCAVYMASGRFIAQEEMPPAAEAQAPDAPAAPPVAEPAPVPDAAPPAEAVTGG